MLLVKTSKLLIKKFDEQLIIFDSNTGQTHCLDSNVNEIFQQLSCNKPTPLSKLKSYFILSCKDDEKAMLNDYIQDMIDNLLKLKLITSCTL